MIRWAVLLFVALVTAWGLSAATCQGERMAAEIPEEDLLAFDLGPGDEVSLLLPPGTEVARLWSSLVVDTAHTADAAGAAGAPDPAARYPYALEVTLVDGAGQALWSHRYEVEGRISVDPAAPERFAARVEGASGRPTDPRTVTVPLAGLTGAPARLLVRARAQGDADAHVLLRATRAARRSGVAARLLERRLRPDDRRRAVAGRAALGYADLPEPVRAGAFDEYEERLSASGESGKSYRLVRMVVTPWRAPFVLTRPSTPVRVGRFRRAALNLAGDMTVRVAAPPGTAIEVREGAGIELPRPALPPTEGEPPPPPPPEDQPRRLVVPESGLLDVALPGSGARTVSFGADAPEAPLLFLVPEGRAAAQIGAAPVAFTPTGEAALAPDLRVSAYHRLHPTEPLRVRVAPGQAAARITLRAELADDDPAQIAQRQVLVRTRVDGKIESEEVVELDLLRSRFDRVRLPGAPRPPLAAPQGQAPVHPPIPVLRDASDPAVLYLRFDPAEDRERTLELLGTTEDLAQVAAPEPGVGEDALSPAYQAALSPGARWRGAVYDARRWATLRPERAAALEQAGRAAELLIQARIEEAGPPGPPRPERVIAPSSGARAQSLVTSVFVPKGAPMPPGATRPLGRDDLVRVESSGPKARRITVSYRAGEDALGGTAALLVDGKEVARAPVMTLAGTLEASVDPGARRVSLTGLGAAGRATVDAPPAEGGVVHQRGEVYVAERGKPITFSWKGREAEPLLLVATVVSPRPGAAYALRYEVRGAPARLGTVVRRLTPQAGTFSGTTTDEGTPGRADAALAAGSGVGVARAVIPIGEDLQAGAVEVRVTLEAPETLWIRGVLVGQEGLGGPRVEVTPRAWTEEAE